MAKLIELNADVGEGGPDALLMPYVSRVSIACGGHVGDADSMRAALLLAQSHGVLPGAHPGYPDAANFGRKAMAASAAQVRDWIIEQTHALQAVADGLGMRLFHVKPHGALYNRAAVDAETARGVLAALRELQGLALIALAGSPLVGWALAAGIPVLEEAFADRRYLGDGTLAPRGLPGAVIEDPAGVREQVARILAGEPVTTLDGGALLVHADTLCLHGEGPHAAEFARLVAGVLSGA